MQNDGEEKIPRKRNRSNANGGERERERRTERPRQIKKIWVALGKSIHRTKKGKADKNNTVAQYNLGQSLLLLSYGIRGRIKVWLAGCNKCTIYSSKQTEDERTLRRMFSPLRKILTAIIIQSTQAQVHFTETAAYLQSWKQEQRRRTDMYQIQISRGCS